MKCHNGREGAIASFSALFIGKALFAFCQFALLILLARLSGEFGVGTYGIASAIAAPVFMFSKMRAGDMVATSQEGTIALHFASIQLLLGGLAIAIVFVIAIMMGLTGPTLVAIVLVAAVKFVEALADVAHGQMQREGKTNVMGLAFGVKGPAGLLGALIASVIVSGDMIAMLSGLLVGHIIVFYSIEYRYLHWPRVGFADVKAYLVVSLPLGIASLLSSATSNVPRYFLEAMVSRDAVGVYTALFGSVIALNVINEAIGRSAIRRLTDSFYQSRASFAAVLRKLICASIALGLMACIVTLAWGDRIVTTVFGEVFSGHGIMLFIITIGVTGALINSHIKRSLIVMRLTRVQIISSGSSMAAVLVTSAVAIPIFGIVGAALAVVAMAWTELAVGLGYMIRALVLVDNGTKLKRVYSKAL